MKRSKVLSGFFLCFLFASPNSRHQAFGQDSCPRMVITGWAAGPTAAPAIEDLPFVRADVNLDGAVDISDPIASLFALFDGSFEFLCDDAADSNDDGSIDISDAIHTLGFLFLGTESLVAPLPLPGEDATPDDPLRCAPAPREGRYAITVRPIRCPASGCDPWADPRPGVGATVEDHVRAIRARAAEIGVTVQSIAVSDLAEGEPDQEPFELTVVFDNDTEATLAGELLEADSRLILAPPGTLSVSIPMLQCGKSPWEQLFGWATTVQEYEEKMIRWLENPPGTTIVSVKGELLNDDETPQVCTPECERAVCVLPDFRLQVTIVGGSMHAAELVHYGWHCNDDRRRASQLSYPAASVYVQTVNACEWDDADADGEAPWAVAAGAPVYLALWSQTLSSVLGPACTPGAFGQPPSDPPFSPGWVFVLSPPNNESLLDAGFNVVE